MEEFKRVDGVSDYLKVSPATVWLYSKQGKITPIKLSPRVTVWAKSDLDAFIERAVMGVAV
ncbi:MAG: helix-turn-helix domain-containing protein [Campylobacterales bacterium]|nr:helix-turn-helix domain-containing protein [Campylobacterales bacterium]